jgi:F420-dependent oxidoreductase-like protein
MRIGIQGGVSGRSANAVDELIATGRAASHAGLDLWVPQLTDLDALTALAVVGHELPGLRTGTGVVPTYTRHPIVMALQALTVQAASGGGFTLGIGLSHRVLIEGVYGVSFDKPIRHMREYLEILMPLLHGGTATFEGEELTARTWAPVRVAGAEPPQVLVAALGTQMLNLAGRLADGTALWMVGARTLAEHVVPTITRAADRAGRPAPRVVVGLPVSVTSDVDAARQRAVGSFALYDTLPSYRAMLDKEGVQGPADVAVIGDEEGVAGELRRFGELGATDLAVATFGPGEDRARTTAVLTELVKG